ncbi:putative CyP450 monooxygenase [Hysterangium stoloniferum]|nr:putative CyP450 monooxygenase [Hysterangium stoloniferum]
MLKQSLWLAVLTTGISLVILVLAHIALNRRRIPKGLQLPPGPPGKFLVGNAGDLPTSNEWKTYTKWAEKYGDLVYLNVLGTSILFVNSNDMAHELFERRSKIYSDRPALTMLHELMGFDWGLAFMPYGESFRRHRQVTQRTLTSASLLRYQPIQLKHARHLLQRLQVSPTNFLEHARHTISGILMEVTYGIQIKPQNDPYVALIEEAIGAAALVASPGAFLVDVIPILKYLPEWFPGAGFQRKARIWRQIVDDMAEVPFQAVKVMMKDGKAQPSLTSTLLEELSLTDDVDREHEERIIRNVTGMMYGGGGDTSVCALEIFFLAMVLYPEAQTMAQKELRDVIGPQALPTLEDRERLPYTNALCKEVLRWHPVAQVSLPHRLTRDDIVGKFFIPAGTIVFGNSWEILHSETLYGRDTDTFRPERFLDDSNREPSAVFGYGRRVCPGRRLAEDTLFIIIASVLHIFSISPSGSTTPSLHAFTPGIICHPENFQCNIWVRSAQALKLLSDLSDINSLDLI